MSDLSDRAYIEMGRLASDIEIFLGTGEGKFDLDDKGRVVMAPIMLDLIHDALLKPNGEDAIRKTLNELPEGHQERPGLIRALELIKYADG